MIRQIVDWILYRLHVKIKKEVSALESLISLVPFIFLGLIVIGIVNSMKLPPLSLWQRTMLKFRYCLHHIRTVVIGY